jgi:predicted nicotinamide N-methyase
VKNESNPSTNMRDDGPDAIIQPTHSAVEHCRTLDIDANDAGRGGNDAQPEEGFHRGRFFEDHLLAQNFSLEHLVQARASITVIANAVMVSKAKIDVGDEAKTTTMLQRLARVVDAEWNVSLPSSSEGSEDASDAADDDDDCGGAASRRYLRRLVETIVNDPEAMRMNDSSGNDECGSSDMDELYEAWATMVACPRKRSVSLRASSTVTFHIPTELVANHAVARTESTAPHMASTAESRDPYLTLRLRTYPYHNDVSLRLWEAGTVLAELLASGQQLSNLVRGRHVVELGSGGIGLTGAVALCCAHAAHYTFTDFSTMAILNLRHNLERNRHSIGDASSWECLCYDWNDAVHYSGADDAEAPLRSSENSTGVGGAGPATCSPVAHISAATVLLAADVAYDDGAIPGLVETFRLFFTSGAHAASTRAAAAPTTPMLDPRSRDDTLDGSTGTAHAECVDENEMCSRIGVVTDTDTISSNNNTEKVAILAVTRRRKSTFDALMRHLRHRLLVDARAGMMMAVELEHVLGPSDDDGNHTSRCGCPARPPPPVLFPTHFVQPRSDVAVFLLRSNSDRGK